MVDFLQNKNSAKEKPSKPKKQQFSWLRNLLHPVNGERPKAETIDLLASAKKQAVEPNIAKAPEVKEKKSSSKDKFSFISKNKTANRKKKSKVSGADKKLSKDGSEKVRKGFDVNLLPATFRFQSTKKIISMLVLWLVSGLVLLAIIFFGISFYGQQITEEGLALEAEIEFLDSEIAKYNQDLAEASDLQIKLLAVDSLLRSHVYWTNFFEALELTTLPGVYYNGFTASLINSDINLSSYAKSYTTVAEQLIAYERFPNIFYSFSVAEASLDEGIGISYNALVNLNRSLFYDQNFVNSEEQ